MFGHVGDVPYLRDMKYTLKTKTSDLSSYELRSIVCESIKWCETNIGTKVSRKRTFKYRVITLPEKCTPAYGCYDYNTNTLYVFRNYATDVKMVIRAVLHEYTHFMQNLRNYHVVLSKVGYDNHPLEKQSRAMEYFYGFCWKAIRKNF